MSRDTAVLITSLILCSIVAIFGDLWPTQQPIANFTAEAQQ